MRISIITPTTDSSVYLNEALESVPSADGVSIEHIIVHDGGGEFVEILNERFPDVRVLRGENEGAAAAVNLGINAASGDFLLVLSSDDRLCPDAIKKLSARAAERPEIQIWSGGAIFFKCNSAGIESISRTLSSRRATQLSMRNILDILPLWNARFYHRSVFEDLGLLNLEFKALCDREFLVRVVIAGIPEAELEAIIYEYRVHEGSATMGPALQREPHYLNEHIVFANRMIDAREMPLDILKRLRAWHGREVTRLLFHHLRRGNLASWWRTLCRESRLRPVWWAWSPTAISASIHRHRNR